MFPYKPSILCMETPNFLEDSHIYIYIYQPYLNHGHYRLGSSILNNYKLSSYWVPPYYCEFLWPFHLVTRVHQVYACACCNPFRIPSHPFTFLALSIAVGKSHEQIALLLGVLSDCRFQHTTALVGIRSCYAFHCWDEFRTWQWETFDPGQQKPWSSSASLAMLDVSSRWFCLVLRWLDMRTVRKHGLLWCCS